LAGGGFYGALYGNVTHNPVGASPAPALGTIRAYQIGYPVYPAQSVRAVLGDIHRVEARRDCFSDGRFTISSG
jgi:hypothetical protein